MSNVRPQMTTTARRVLEDAKVAILAHSDHLTGPSFRASWFSIVGLLRSVGHVLAKVDAEADPALARLVAQAWTRIQSTKPEPKIFWGFIESERNRFLKNYEHGITRLKVFHTTEGGQALVLDIANSGKLVQMGTLRSAPPHVPDRGILSVLSDGPFAGRPEREVALEAVAWWDAYLREIEQAADPSAEA
jgi:hypothetical protein